MGGEKGEIHAHFRIITVFLVMKLLLLIVFLAPFLGNGWADDQALAHLLRNGILDKFREFISEMLEASGTEHKGAELRVSGHQMDRFLGNLATLAKERVFSRSAHHWTFWIGGREFVTGQYWELSLSAADLRRLGTDRVAQEFREMVTQSSDKLRIMWSAAETRLGRVLMKMLYYFAMRVCTAVGCGAEGQRWAELFQKSYNYFNYYKVDTLVDITERMCPFRNSSRPKLRLLDSESKRCLLLPPHPQPTSKRTEVGSA